MNNSTNDIQGNNANAVLGDVYHQILRFFVGNDEMRPVMMSPFIQEDFAIATDAHALICFKKELLGETEIEANEKAPNALSIIPTEENMSIEFDTIEMRKQISKSRKLADETYEVKKSKCPDCNGSGFVDYEFEDYKGRTHEIEDACPTCESEDEWVTIKNKKTGDEIEDFRELFKIDNALVDVDLFEKLVKTAELLSIEKFKLAYRKSKNSLNKFIVGECTICIASVYQATDDDLVLNIA